MKAPSSLSENRFSRTAVPTLDALSPELGTPEAVVMDNGYFSESNITACESRGIEPYIATGRAAKLSSPSLLVKASQTCKALRILTVHQAPILDVFVVLVALSNSNRRVSFPSIIKSEGEAHWVNIAGTLSPDQ